MGHLTTRQLSDICKQAYVMVRIMPHEIPPPAIYANYEIAKSAMHKQFTQAVTIHADWQQHYAIYDNSAFCDNTDVTTKREENYAWYLYPVSEMSINISV